MKQQITIRGFGEELESKLHAVARKHRISLNKAAIILMKQGAGLRPENEGPQTVGHSLDTFIGSWSAEKERALLESIVDLERPDEDFWK